jgi:hypothetical protein
MIGPTHSCDAFELVYGGLYKGYIVMIDAVRVPETHVSYLCTTDENQGSSPETLLR